VNSWSQFTLENEWGNRLTVSYRWLIGLEADAEGANAAGNESEEDKEIEEFCPSELQDEDRDKEGRKRLTDGTDAIDEASCAAVQLAGDGVEDGHGGHEDIGSIDQNSH
jgi:hypothetical protein